MRGLALILMAVLLVSACSDDESCPTKTAVVFTGDFEVTTELDTIPLWASYEADKVSCSGENTVGSVAWDEDDSAWGQVIQNSNGEWMVHVNVDEVDSGSIRLGWLECKYVALTGGSLNDDAQACSESTE